MKSSSHAPTLRSIAQELKIHVSTVSRVLNGTDEDARAAASEPTVRRIRELAQQRNYRPNLQAKGLRTNRSNSIAAFLPYISDLVGAMIYEGINENFKQLIPSNKERTFILLFFFAKVIVIFKMRNVLIIINAKLHTNIQSVDLNGYIRNFNGCVVFLKKKFWNAGYRMFYAEYTPPRLYFSNE